MMEFKQAFLCMTLWTAAYVKGEAQPNTEVNFCEVKKTKVSDFLAGVITFDSAINSDFYLFRSCSCSICDTATVKLEKNYRTEVIKNIFTGDDQLLQFSYPYGLSYGSTTYHNNTKESNMSTSLYLGCLNFTLVLNKKHTDIKVLISGEVRRDQVTFTCDVDGPQNVNEQVPESTTETGSNSVSLGVGVGIGVAALLVILAVSSCLLYKYRYRFFLSRMHDEQSYTNKYGSGEKPELHRNLDVDAMTKKSDELFNNNRGNEDSEPSVSQSAYENSAYHNDDPEENAYDFIEGDRNNSYYAVEGSKNSACNIEPYDSEVKDYQEVTKSPITTEL